MDNTIPNYQSSSQLTAAISKLEKLSQTSASFDELVIAAQRLMPGHHHHAFPLPERTWLYRARIFRNSDRPTSQSSLSYPPSVGAYHRAGPPGVGSFYCSDSLATALKEVHPVEGDVVAISEWATTKELMLIMAGFSQALVKEWAEDSDTYSSFADEAEWLSAIPAANIEGNLKVREYLARRFTETVNPNNLDGYKISAAIARALGYSPVSKSEFDRGSKVNGGSDGPPFDGILYPSIVQRGKHVNIAFRPYSVDKYLKFKSVSLYRVSETLEDNIKSVEFDFSRTFDSNGEFVWKGSPGVYSTRWPGDQIHLKSVGPDQYNVTDADGRQIERS